MIQTLVSVPSRFDAWLRSSRRAAKLAPFRRFADFVGSDPDGSRLGSGGGTVSLLHSAWQETREPRQSLADWIGSAQRVVLHAGGESRRLPAYASVGKALLPVPTVFETGPRRYDQVLADFQIPAYRSVLREAGSGASVLVASGDVWLELDPLTLPSVRADVVGIGMKVSPEVARDFGVFFVGKAPAAANGLREHPVAFFVQKPSAQDIYRRTPRYDFFVDTGLWLLSARAVAFLFRRCGWSERARRFETADGRPRHLDLYSEIGPAMGTETPQPPALRRHGWPHVTRSVVPMDDARFHHVGSSRQLLETFEQLGGNRVARPKVFSSATPTGPSPHISNLPVWLDGAGSRENWILEGLNIVSGTRNASSRIRLRQGQCVEIASVGNGCAVVRGYGLDDTFSGAANGAGMICGQDAPTWLARRGFPESSADVFELPIYPVVRQAEIGQEIIDWFFDPEPRPELTRRFLAGTKVSSAQIPERLDFTAYFVSRSAGHTAALLAQFEACLRTGDQRVFDQDFAAVAAHARRSPRLENWLLRQGSRLAAHVARSEHRSRLSTLLAELSSGAARERLERRAQAELQQAVLGPEAFPRSRPRLSLKEDQIVWGRSPVRLDLAGGWTDTPPYCLERGGAVVNVAVLLNGQPPIQAFVRPLTEPVISLRSIDLGSSEIIRQYAELRTFRDPRSGFSLPKAALALAGFLPEYVADRPASTLRDQLMRFGGGLEISLLSAVPKGSGLGTSSILAATILGVLNRACALGWDEVGLYFRVLGVEQLLTTGGGWQDQAGALFRGIKLIETTPGPAQIPGVRYLPHHLFGPVEANRTLLLYYTGLTRLAKGILAEIVRDMFLGRFDTSLTLRDIRANALRLFNAIQQSDAGAMRRCVARSWDLNKRLDRGTTTAAIEEIISFCGPDLAAAKLLGAGGGGYMLMCARDAEAGQRIRSRLEQEPPNPRSRFIDFEVAESGLEVTVS